MSKIKLLASMMVVGLLCIYPIYNYAQDGFAMYSGTTTGGAGGTTVTVSSASSFLDYISRSGSYIIQLNATINLSGMNDVASNKTIIGVGTSGRIVGGGLDLDGVSNIIIRNIEFTGWDDDAINMQESANHIWVDHCTFSNGYDGCVDIKRGSDFITVSWNHFYNHGKTCLLGHSDSNASQDVGHLRVTYHHNYFDGTDTRHPRVRFSALTHVYNNYFRDNEYGVASTEDAEVLVENNYFQDCEDPTLVGYASSGDGDLVQRNNIFAGSTGSPESAGTVPSPPYSYTLDAASSIPSIVTSGAGVGNIGSTGGGGSTTNPETPSCGTCGSNLYNGGVFAIIPRHDESKALEVYNFDASNGGNVNQWTYWGGDYQHWIATDRGSGYWSFAPVPASGRAMDVFEISTADGANINVWDYWGGDGQLWYFSNAGSGGWVRIKSKLSGKCVDVINFSTADGANVMQWPCISGNYNQMFRFASVSGSRMGTNSIADLEASNEVSIYPIPAKGTLNVNLPESFKNGASIRLYNTTGQLFLSKQVKDLSNSIDISTIPTGMYVLKINNGQITQTKKVVVE